MCENEQSDGVFTILLPRGAGYGPVNGPAFQPGTLEEGAGVRVHWFDEEGYPRSLFADVLEVGEGRAMGGVVVDPYTIKARVRVKQIPHGATVEPANVPSPMEALTRTLFGTDAGEEVLAHLEEWYGLAAFPVPEGGLEFLPVDVLSEEKVGLKGVL